MDQQQSITGKLQSVTSMMSNPLGQMMFKGAFDGIKKQGDGLLSKIFTPEIRDYFNVNTDLVRKKMLKLVVPFKTFEWDDQIKKLQLYIPLISFTTLILFSTIVQGISSEKFQPKMGKKMIFILFLTFIEVVIAKCSQNVVSNLNIGYLELSSLVSYRFVPLAILTIILTLTSLSIPYLNLIGLIYVLISDTYFCKLELNAKSRVMFQEEGLGTKIALLVHFFVTLIISWVCDII